VTVLLIRPSSHRLRALAGGEADALLVGGVGTSPAAEHPNAAGGRTGAPGAARYQRPGPSVLSPP
jgi:hypothetical protein